MRNISRPALILTVVLAAHAGVFYTTSRSETLPSVRPLAEFPLRIEPWRTVREGYIDDETQAVLRADDTLSRVYASEDGNQFASLFVAFFKSQRTGQTPHSPKNCLPGSGWEITRGGPAEIAIPGQAEGIQVNRYLVTKGEQRDVVLYWYQTPKRVIASELEAKGWLVADAIRYNRTDTALVRVVVPVVRDDEAAASTTGTTFAQALFPALKAYLPE
jgi:EpsI family protein